MRLCRANTGAAHRGKTRMRDPMLRSAQRSEYRLIGMMDNDDDNDTSIDFSNAVLYVGLMQVVMATVLCAVTSLLCCWLFPQTMVSAVRTLVLSSLVPALIVRKPFRLGRVRGLSIVFNALRPCCALYVASLVAEQLTHSCAREIASPSWRRLVFHAMIAVCLFSGFARARSPLQHTDLPFLVVCGAFFVIAMLPPPAVLLSGPLCAIPGLYSAAERVVRAFTFSSAYCIFVYAAAPPTYSNGEVLVCVMRAGAASVWILACHAILLPLAVLQCGIVIYRRITAEDSGGGYGQLGGLAKPPAVASAVETDEEACSSESTLVAAVADEEEERVGTPPPLPSSISLAFSDLPTAAAAAAASAAGAQSASTPDPEKATSEAAASSAAVEDGLISLPRFTSIGPRGLVDIGATAAPEQKAGGGVLSSAQLAEIAARLSDD